MDYTDAKGIRWVMCRAKGKWSFNPEDDCYTFRPYDPDHERNSILSNVRRVEYDADLHPLTKEERIGLAERNSREQWYVENPRYSNHEAAGLMYRGSQKKGIDIGKEEELFLMQNEMKTRNLERMSFTGMDGKEYVLALKGDPQAPAARIWAVYNRTEFYESRMRQAGGGEIPRYVQKDPYIQNQIAVARFRTTGKQSGWTMDDGCYDMLLNYMRKNNRTEMVVQASQYTNGDAFCIRWEWDTGIFAVYAPEENALNSPHPGIPPLLFHGQFF